MALLLTLRSLVARRTQTGPVTHIADAALLALAQLGAVLAPGACSTALLLAPVTGVSRLAAAGEGVGAGAVATTSWTGGNTSFVSLGEPRATLLDQAHLRDVLYCHHGHQVLPHDFPLEGMTPGYAVPAVLILRQSLYLQARRVHGNNLDFLLMTKQTTKKKI